MAQNISLLGATYSAVPAVLLPKQGGGTARFDDASITTAVASDVASGKQFLAADGTITTGTASGGGGQSSYELIGRAEFTASTTTTSAQSVGTMTLTKSAWQHAKLIYVRVRDKAGKRNGYYYGNDDFFSNTGQASGSTAEYTGGGRICFRVNSSGVVESTVSTGTTGYGLYARGINTDGNLTIYKRYNSTSSLTVNGTYVVEAYLLSWPDDVNPYD